MANDKHHDDKRHHDDKHAAPAKAPVKPAPPVRRPLADPDALRALLLRAADMMDKVPAASETHEWKRAAEALIVEIHYATMVERDEGDE